MVTEDDEPLWQIEGDDFARRWVALGESVEVDALAGGEDQLGRPKQDRHQDQQPHERILRVQQQSSVEGLSGPKQGERPDWAHARQGEGGTNEVSSSSSSLTVWSSPPGRDRVPLTDELGKVDRNDAYVEHDREQHVLHPSNHEPESKRERGRERRRQPGPTSRARYTRISL